MAVPAYFGIWSQDWLVITCRFNVQRCITGESNFCWEVVALFGARKNAISVLPGLSGLVKKNRGRCAGLEWQLYPSPQKGCVWSSKLRFAEKAVGVRTVNNTGVYLGVDRVLCDLLIG